MMRQSSSIWPVRFFDTFEALDVHFNNFDKSSDITGAEMVSVKVIRFR